MSEPAWINTAYEGDEGEHLHAVIASCADPTTGRLDNIMRVYCLNPQSM